MDSNNSGLLAHLRGIALLLAFPLLFLAACDGDNDKAAPALIRADVSATSGGIFADNPGNPRVSLTIPPGALNAGDRVALGFPRV